MSRTNFGKGKGRVVEVKKIKMDYFIILADGEIYTKEAGGINSLPFTYEEVQEALIKKPHAKCVNISEDIREYNIIIKNNPLLEAEQQLVYSWKTEYSKRTIHGFCMPIKVGSNEEYIKKLEDILELYQKQIHKVAFKYIDNLESDVTRICKDLLRSLSLYLNGNRNLAGDTIASLIDSFRDDLFWISELDKSYAFRGVAPFSYLHHQGYEDKYKQILQMPIDFYRARTEKVTIRQDMVHIPYNLINYVKEQRFSLTNYPCLYLGTSSYDCWKECREPDLENFYISSFRANEAGKKLRIFNLAVSQELVNGFSMGLISEKERILIQISMIKLLPIVFATSFTVNDMSRKGEKYEYIISHLIMQSLAHLNVDGVAYLSKQGKNDFQYPEGVNLAIPVYDINEQKPYGNICKKFKITEPKAFKDILKYESNPIFTCYIQKAFKGHYEPIADNLDFARVDNNITTLEYDYPNFLI